MLGKEDQRYCESCLTQLMLAGRDYLENETLRYRYDCVRCGAKYSEVWVRMDWRQSQRKSKPAPVKGKAGLHKYLDFMKKEVKA